jgi:hypothetical protein
MQPEERKAIAMKIGLAVLRSRSDVQQFLNEAIASGNKKMARSFASQLRKIDEQIAKYGLSKYADRI